jgi:hypothetical protein
MVNGTVNYDIDRLSSLSFNPLFKNFKTKCFKDLDPDTKFYDEIDCNYYLADQFNDALETFAVADSSLFTVMHLNICSLTQNIENLSDYLLCLAHKFSIIGLSFLPHPNSWI